MLLSTFEALQSNFVSGSTASCTANWANEQMTAAVGSSKRLEVANS